MRTSYDDHAVYDDFGDVVVGLDEGQRITEALGGNKAAILQDHGLLIVDEATDEMAWWLVTMERSCQMQLLAEAAVACTGEISCTISDTVARRAYSIVESTQVGWFRFQPLYTRIVKEHPDLPD